MKFIDEATITVESGNGGSGCVSFRRERCVPRGGPDGGDGGKGGDVVITASAQRRTLYQFRHQRFFKAKNGAQGQGSQKTGGHGQDVIIQVPLGTLVMDADSGQLIADFDGAGKSMVIARGGRGGKGNLHFKSSTHRAPRFAQPGEPGQAFTLRLELKLLADVGLMGLPNAGKSTLISVISSARPKIADYPFTTLVPNLGVVQPPSGEPFVVADIPGLVEGAHEGVGLGIQFLRHIERTRILVHLIDAAAIDEHDPLGGYRTINRELSRYSEALATKPQIVVLNKIDLPDARHRADIFLAAFDRAPVFQISAATRTGVVALLTQIITLLDTFHAPESKDIL